MHFSSILSTTAVASSIIYLLTNSLNVLSDVQLLSDDNNKKIVESQSIVSEQGNIIEKLQVKIQKAIDIKKANQLREADLFELASTHVNELQTKLETFEEVNIDNTIAEYCDVSLLVNPYSEVLLYTYEYSDSIIKDEFLNKYNELCSKEDFIIDVEIISDNGVYYPVCNIFSKSTLPQDIVYTATNSTFINELKSLNLESKIIFRFKGSDL